MDSPHLQDCVSSDSTAEPAATASPPPVVEPTRSRHALGVRWRDRPTPTWAVAAMFGLILVMPAWMLWDYLRTFTLFSDDFSYVAAARDWPTTRAHLLEPINAHIIPF